MDILALGGVKKILGKYADPIINKIAEISKGEWEKFKVDFDLAFIEYINNAYEKYSKAFVRLFYGDNCNKRRICVLEKEIKVLA